MKEIIERVTNPSHTIIEGRRKNRNMNEGNN
jgi:hypothetical protein